MNMIDTNQVNCKVREKEREKFRKKRRFGQLKINEQEEQEKKRIKTTKNQTMPL